MLKFLENRTNEKNPRSPIKYKPEMIYGISVQSPNQFQHPSTIVHQDSYLNPYLKFENQRSACLSQQKIKKVKPDWVNKVDLQMVEEQKIISSKLDDDQIFKSRYYESYHNQLKHFKHRFKKTRGEFTDFIEKNNHYKSVGPLHGEERTMKRIQETKKTVWLKPNISEFSIPGPRKNVMTYDSYFDAKRENSFHERSFGLNSSSISNNSKMITEKTRIRDNRKRTNDEFGKHMEERKKASQYTFSLPKVSSDLSTVSKMYKKRIAPESQQLGNDELQDLDSFEKNLKKKFR